MRTEQTQKLDVQTLEYVFSMVKTYEDIYRRKYLALDKCGNAELSANRAFARSNAMHIVAGRIYDLIHEQQQMVKMKSYPVKTAEDAFDLVLFALDMEIVKKDIARQDMEEKGDVWEVDRYTYEIDGLKSFEQLLTKLIEMQK